MRPARRIHCLGACGRWWFYDAPKGGRPRVWCDRCARLRKNERNRQDYRYERDVLGTEARR